MYHHVKKLMYTVNIGEPDPDSETCCWSSLAEPTENWPLPCSIPSKASTAKILPAKTF